MYGFTFKAIHDLAPAYINELISARDTTARHHLHSNNGLRFDYSMFKSLAMLGILFTWQPLSCGMIFQVLSETLCRLHSPVDKITVIRKNLKARDVHCADGIVFVTSDGGPMKAIPFADGAINISSKPKKKHDFINLTNRLQLTSTGTVTEIKERLNRYFLSLKSTYHGHDYLLWWTYGIDQWERAIGERHVVSFKCSFHLKYKK